MKTNVLLCIGLVVVVSTVRAQDLDMPTFLGGNVGLSFPVGRFAKDYDVDAVSGQRGYVLTFEGAKFFNRYFGVGGQFSYNRNQVNETELRNALAIEGYRNDGFYIIRLAAGLYGSVPIVDEIGFHYKLLGGYSMVRKGAIKAEGQKIFDAQVDNTYCIIGGLGMRYLIVPRIFARVSGEFIYTNTNLKPTPGEDTQSLLGYQQKIAEVTSGHPLNVITLSVGIDYIWEYSQRTQKRRKSRR